MDDGIRLYLDGVPIMDEWRVARGRLQRRARPAGRHQVMVEYFDAFGEANIRVDWPVLPD